MNINKKLTELEIMKKSLEEVKANMLAERDRVTNERKKISDRINELKNKRKSTLMPIYDGSLSLDDIEKAAVDESNEVITEKIALMNNVLQKGYMADSQYRTMAMVYLEELEPIIQKLTEEKQTLIDESIKALREAEENREQALHKANGLDDEINDLLEPLGVSVYAGCNMVSGPYVINRTKAEIAGWNNKTL